MNCRRATMMILAAMMLLVLSHAPARAACDWDAPGNTCEDGLNGCIDDVIDSCDTKACKLDGAGLCYILWAPPDFWGSDEPDGEVGTVGYYDIVVEAKPAWGDVWFESRVVALEDKIQGNVKGFARAARIPERQVQVDCEIVDGAVRCTGSSALNVAAVSLRTVCVLAEGSFSTRPSERPGRASRRRPPPRIEASCALPCATCAARID